MRSLARGVAVLALMTVAVSAHGPTRQKVTETVEINAPPEQVWKSIGNFRDMRWHPAIEKVEGVGDHPEDIDADPSGGVRLRRLLGHGRDELAALDLVGHVRACRARPTWGMARGASVSSFAEVLPAECWAPTRARALLRREIPGRR